MMPTDAIVGGRDRDGVTPLYICRIDGGFGTNLHGKALNGGPCWVAAFGGQTTHQSYEVLTGMSLHWVPATGVVQGAVASGVTSPSYICRGRPPNGVEPANGPGLHPGMLSSNGACEIAYGNAAYQPANFEVLRNPWVPVTGATFPAGTYSVNGFNGSITPCRAWVSSGGTTGVGHGVAVLVPDVRMPMLRLAALICRIPWLDSSVGVYAFEVLTSFSSQTQPATPNVWHPNSFRSIFSRSPYYHTKLCFSDTSAGTSWDWVGCQTADNPVASNFSVTIPLESPPAAGSCPYTLNTSSISIGAGGGNASANLSTVGECAWSVSATSWITLTSPASGKGNTTISFLVAANLASTPRNGQITIAGQTVTVTQAAATSLSISCTPTSGPSTVGQFYTTTCTASGGTPAYTWSTVSGTLPTGLSLSSSTGNPVTVSGTPTSAGDFSYSVRVADSGGQTKTQPFIGTIQAGVGVSVSPTSTSLYSGQNRQFIATVTNSGNTAVTWSVVPAGTGSLAPSGNTATYTAPVVNSPLTVTVRATSQADPTRFGDATITVNPAPVVAVSPKTASLGQGESLNFIATVTGAPDTSVTWSILSGPGSVTAAGRYSAPASIASTQTAILQAASNAFPAIVDTATIQLRANDCTVRLSADSAAFENPGGPGSVNVETSAGCAWTATSNQAWVVITAGSAGNGSGVVRFDVAPGTGQPRVAVLSIAGRIFTINQGGLGCIAGLNPPKLALGSASGSRVVALTMSSAACRWTAASQAGWMRVTSASQGEGSGSISIAFDENGSSVSRSGALSVAGLLLTVTQSAANCDAITVSRATQSFPAAGGRGSIPVQAPEGCAYSVTNTGSLLTLDPPANRSGEGVVTFQVLPNLTNAVRDGVITVAGTKVLIRQSGQTSATIACQVLNVTDPISVRSNGHSERLSPLDITCSGRGGGRIIAADVVVSLNAGVGNRLSGAAADLVDATLTISGGGTVAGRLVGGNAVRFAVPLSNGEPSINIQMRIDGIRAAPSLLGTTSDPQGVPIVATVQIQSPVDLSITGARQTIGISRAALRFQQGQLRDGPAGGQKILPVVVEEAFPSAFRNREGEGSGSDTGTRFLLNLSNLPDDIQLFAPVNPLRGSARLMSADGNGVGGSPVAGSPRAGGTYERVPVSAGRAFAVWELTQADSVAADSLEFPMLIEGGTASTLASVRTQILLAPLFDASAASPTAPLPRFVAPDRPSLLQDLRLQADVRAGSAGGPVIPGQTATLSYVVINESDHPATDVVLHGTLSDALSNVTCTSPRPCTTSGRDLRVLIGPLNPGERATVSLSAAVGGVPNCPNCVSHGTTIPSTAGVSALGNDPVAANNYLEVPIEVDSPCQFNLSRQKATVAGGGATLQVDVFTGPSCEWTQPGMNGGVAVNPAGALRGSVTFSLIVPANPSETERVLNVTLGGQNLEVIQAGRSCSFTIPNQPSIPSAGGSFQVQFQTGCAWKALAGPDWLRITSAGAGTGSATLNYTAQPNPSIVTRLGWVEIGGQTVTISQQPVSAMETCTFSLNRTSGTASASGDTLGVVVSTQASNCAWNAQTDASWVAFGGSFPRNGTGTLRIVVAANASGARLANLTIAGKNFSLHQAGAGCSFAVTPATMSAGSPGGTFTLSIATQPACAFTAVSSQPWIAMQGNGIGSGTGPAAFNVQSNGGAARTGSISVAGEFHQIVQAASTQQQQFGDVPAGHGFYNFVSIMRDRGITSGCGNVNYCPDALTTRGQMAVFIIRAIMGGDQFAFSTTPFFTDVPSTHGFFKWIQKMRELGITTGCTASTYCPDASVTRGQMAAFVVRARLGLAGGDSFSFPSAVPFSDVPTAHPFYGFIQKMRQLGITSGCSANAYCPDSDTTRGQMSVFIVRGLLTP